MGAADGLAAGDVDLALDRLALLDPAVDDFADMEEVPVRAKRVEHVDLARCRAERAGIANLPAGLAVERCLVEHDGDLGANVCDVDEFFTVVAVEVAGSV